MEKTLAHDGRNGTRIRSSKIPGSVGGQFTTCCLFGDQSLNPQRGVQMASRILGEGPMEGYARVSGLRETKSSTVGGQTTRVQG